MAGDIKQKIVLEGEKEYNAAIKEAQRNLRVLKSELKAETAELGKNATAQQQNEAKVKSLQKQIKEQERIVRTYEDALKQVKAQYGDNEEAIAKWEIKLNDARTALANMKNGLDSTSAGLKKVGESSQMGVVAAKSFADSLERISSVGDSVSGAIESAFGTMVGHLTDAVGELWSMISETAARADEWSDLAGFWGTDPQTIQKYARAVGSVNDSFGDLNAIVSRLVMGGKGKEIAELIGVSNVNYDGTEWDYAMAVMDKLRKMQEEGQNLTPIYEKIFGEKKSQKVMDLVNDWDQIQKKLATYNGDEGGFGMSSDDLANMQQVQLMITDIQQKWEALQDKFAAGFAKVTLDVGVNASGVLEGLNDLMSAETPGDQEAALQKIRENVEEACRKIGEAIKQGLEVLKQVGEELQGSEDPVTRAIGNILTSLTESLQWMIENQEKVKMAFEAIFGVWLVGKLTMVAGQLANILAQIETIKTFKGLGTAGAAAGAGTGGGAFGFLAILKAAIPNALAAIGTWELTKLLPADLITLLSGGKAKEVGEITKNAGIETVGDAMENVAKNPERSKKSLGLIWNALANPGAGAEEPAKVEEKIAEPIAEEIHGALTQEQAALTEAFWDAWRGFVGGDGSVENLDAFDEADAAWRAAFEGQDDLLDKIDHLIMKMEEEDDWTNIEDLPASFWQDAGGISESDLQGFRNVPNQMAAAVQRGAAAGVSGIQVIMDAERVGRLVAPYVSQGIAQSVLISPV